ncbi:hypothetical protein PPYR_07173 [Photinus pyralis]|uniref:Uncharacterized protein n=1 Tax=Photinus pyralis TaxID=7054 RepID=A0A1Y1L7C9_PHOPY|nr:uncharacterized protein LOC116168885 [Photinus pyralis]KAB0799293.1 hypothetical protein PPYR_07173 [Photinus pyralis]
MVALRLLPALQIIFILCTPCLSYPVFGTKRYNGRSAVLRRANNNYSWGTSVQPYQQFLRAQRFPVNYYEMYPYGRDYQDDYYYPQETISYPLYIPPPRTSKYEVYQAVLPYYYGDRPLARQDYGYYGYEKSAEPIENLEDDIIQEAQREEREDAQPIGQEVLYENEDGEESLDDVNAAFLQNLIMSQMYKDASSKQKNYYDQYPSTDYYYDEDNYEKWDDTQVLPKQTYQEDEDVRELKQLVKPQRQDVFGLQKGPSAEERLHLFRNENKNKNPKGKFADKHGWDGKRSKSNAASMGSLRYTVNDFPRNDLPLVLKATSSPAVTPTSLPKATSTSPKRDSRKGQKEEVLMRPATPIKNPFSSKVLEMMKEPERKREPSVYDTIKHMLDVEKSLENSYRANEMRSPMRKRIITDEDSLIQQLSLLKKAQ